MPTEQIFSNSTPLATRSIWASSRDYAGRDFRAYVSPRTYRPLSDGLNLRDYLNLTAQGQVLTLFEPQAKPRFGYTANELRSLQVSPNIKAGIYDKDATALVYYMDDVNQYTVSYRLTKLADLELSQLIDPNDLTTGEAIRLRFREFLIGLVPSGQIQTGSDTIDGIIEFIQDRFDYSQFLAVWTATGFVSQPLSVVTSTPRGGSAFGSTNGTTSSPSTDGGSVPLLPLALIAGGLFAGAPVVALGGGALLLLSGRGDDGGSTVQRGGTTIRDSGVVTRVTGSRGALGGAGNAADLTAQGAIGRERVITPVTGAPVTFRGLSSLNSLLAADSPNSSPIGTLRDNSYRTPSSDRIPAYPTMNALNCSLSRKRLTTLHTDNSSRQRAERSQITMHI